MSPFNLILQQARKNIDSKHTKISGPNIEVSVDGGWRLQHNYCTLDLLGLSQVREENVAAGGLGNTWQDFNGTIATEDITWKTLVQIGGGWDNIKIQNFSKTSCQSTNWVHLDQDRTHKRDFTNMLVVLGSLKKGGGKFSLSAPWRYFGGVGVQTSCTHS